MRLRWIPDQETVKSKVERQECMGPNQGSVAGPIQLEHERIDEGFSWETKPTRKVAAGSLLLN